MEQIRFDPLDHDEDAAAAKAARDARWRALRAEGRKASRWVLRDQLRKYAGLGIPDGRIRDVYYITVYS